jgi:hypothetical protein
MRVLVCGGRNYADRHVLFYCLDALNHEASGLEIGVGYNPKDKRYQGADQIAYEWAKGRGVPGRCYPAHWDLQGDAAGPMRNQRMLEMFQPDLVVAFLTTDKPNIGTQDMMRRARAAGVEVRVGSR